MKSPTRPKRFSTLKLVTHCSMQGQLLREVLLGEFITRTLRLRSPGCVASITDRLVTTQRTSPFPITMTKPFFLSQWWCPNTYKAWVHSPALQTKHNKTRYVEYRERKEREQLCHRSVRSSTAPFPVMSRFQG